MDKGALLCSPSILVPWSAAGLWPVARSVSRLFPAASTAEHTLLPRACQPSEEPPEEASGNGKSIQLHFLCLDASSACLGLRTYFRHVVSEPQTNRWCSLLLPSAGHLDCDAKLSWVGACHIQAPRSHLPRPPRWVLLGPFLLPQTMGHQLPCTTPPVPSPPPTPVAPRQCTVESILPLLLSRHPSCRTPIPVTPEKSPCSGAWHAMGAGLQPLATSGQEGYRLCRRERLWCSGLS